ncbi:MAG: hypothetical protein ACK4N4_04070 [Burkholderiales bacterium]
MKGERERLLELFEALDERRRQTLIEFAEFLMSRAARDGDAESVATSAPQPIARPAAETVVMAIKRLTRTYPMLDRRKLLGETSEYVAQHALGGRPATEVIDELEALFARHYEKLKDS